MLAIATLLLLHGQASSQHLQKPLQLEVFINDQPTRLIGAFVQLPNVQIAVKRPELVELGIDVPTAETGSPLVVLDALPGLTYRYDERAQAIYFNIDNRQRTLQKFDARGQSKALAAPQEQVGSVLNYTLFASSMNATGQAPLGFALANAALDARLFGPFGTLSQSAIVGATDARSSEVLRLETSWRYSDQRTLLTYRMGDSISNGLAWTRPIRFGGIQIQTNFGLRPDLITMPLPVISGTAAVPSTVDVYFNNIKTHSQDVAAGPYEISNVPLLSDGGATRVVLRDATGRETVTSMPFYTSPKLLRAGLTDFSVEVGSPRLNYGSESNTYVPEVVGALTLRGGLYDNLTIEGHAEGGGGLASLGLGAVLGLEKWGLLSVAANASRYDDAQGFRTYVAYDARIAGLQLHASTQRVFGDFNDLASTSARYPVPGAVLPGISTAGTTGLPLLLDAKTPRSLQRLSLGIPLATDKSWLNASYLQMEVADGTVTNLFTVSYSRPLLDGASFNATAYCDASDGRSRGAMLSISMPLGKSMSTTTALSSSPIGTNATAEFAKALQPEIGSVGWRVRDTEGNAGNRYAEASYRSSIAEMRGGLQQTGRSTSGFVQANGSVATMGDGIFFANRIDDAFAVVKAGAPDVDVLYENRIVGKTNSDGLLLLPQLRSYQSNKIAIDPLALPVEAEAPETQKVVAPADRGGMLVDFGVRRDVQAAVVIMIDPSGRFIEPGSRGRLEQSDEDFVVGYDGRAFIKGLSSTNRIRISIPEAECRASFDFVARAGRQVIVGPVTCE